MQTPRFFSTLFLGLLIIGLLLAESRPDCQKYPKTNQISQFRMTETLKSAEKFVFLIIASIPKGKVTSYGQIARMAGIPSHARLVGRIISRLPKDTDLPWHRVVDSQGRIANPNELKQREKLEQEGVTVINGKINLRHYRWKP